MMKSFKLRPRSAAYAFARRAKSSGTSLRLIVLVSMTSFVSFDTSGIGSTATVSRALAHLQKLHAIQISRGLRIGVTRACSTYRVTLDDSKFLERCNEVLESARGEISREREYRAELRKTRQSLTLNTAKAGGLRPPDPPCAPSFQIQEKEKPVTCKGLNLSSPIEVNSDKALHCVKRDIRVDLERQKQILRERGFLP